MVFFAQKIYTKMVEVEFNYQQSIIKIQANINDRFQLIIEKYLNKINLDINNIYFLSNGKKISKDDILGNIMNESDKRNNKIIILVYSINIIKSNEIICPICKEICKYEIKDYKIKLYDCKNGHIIKDIKLNEFVNKQNIDISEIKCDNCKEKNKSNTYNNEMYICNECNMNLCPLCKSIHDKSHIIINYENKNYICKEHNETFVKYCKNCKKDLCLSCINGHKNHKIISYEDELKDMKNLRNSMKILEEDINKFKMNIEEIINKYKKIIENLDIYYNINNNIIKEYEMNKNRNYMLLNNIKSIDRAIEIEIRNIREKYDYGYNTNRLLYLYSEMNDKNMEILIKYKPKEDNEEKVRIFSEEFVNNNIHKCRIIYKEEEYELKEYLEDIDADYDNELQ